MRQYKMTRISKRLQTGIQKKIGLLFVLLGLFVVCANSVFAQSPLSPGNFSGDETIVKSGNFMVREHLVVDLQNGVEWMRCSVGQVWNGAGCEGEAMQLTQNEVAQAIVIANEQLGIGWRLPSRLELEGLVCNECAPVKIELDSFPNTLAEPYWSGEVNGYAPRHIWTVNFMTGHTYGRFFPSQSVLVRLVRDR
ncbi:DUF1566 domain-containing protein [Candidatus Puniceispirillum sp.]|nr:DUF1566 domain-containing protein [Candidatus Puniceispirillum sp.]